MSIAINCTGSDTIKLHQLTEFQGGLKHRTDADVEKIIKSIRKHGFSFPFFVWAHATENGNYINHVLDGHGRLLALQKIAESGEQIPPLPCVYISAENEAEAKEKLLKLNSQYGQMSVESVLEFVGDTDIDLEDLQLPDNFIDFTAISPDDFGTDFTLPDKDQTFKEMTFQFSIRQAEIVKSVLDSINDWQETDGNPNSNGNKLFKVVSEWAEQKK